MTAIIGPSGCGKSTHIRVYNRIFELYRDQRAQGEVLLDGENILAPDVDLIELRRRVGMIFQKPTPFPMSDFENVAYGLRLHYRISRGRTGRTGSRRARRGCPLGRGQGRARPSRARPCPAASSSACASPAPSRSSRR